MTDHDHERWLALTAAALVTVAPIWPWLPHPNARQTITGTAPADGRRPPTDRRSTAGPQAGNTLITGPTTARAPHGRPQQRAER